MARTPDQIISDMCDVAMTLTMSMSQVDPDSMTPVQYGTVDEAFAAMHGGRFAWSVATYVDFSEFNRNGVVDRFIVQGLSMDDAIRLVLKLENEARKEVSCHTPTASAALSPDTTGSTNLTS